MSLPLCPCECPGTPEWRDSHPPHFDPENDTNPEDDDDDDLDLQVTT